MARPEGMAPWQHIDAAEEMLTHLDQEVSENYRAQTGESKTDALLSVIAHALIAYVKMIGAQRA